MSRMVAASKPFSRNSSSAALRIFSPVCSAFTVGFAGVIFEPVQLQYGRSETGASTTILIRFKKLALVSRRLVCRRSVVALELYVLQHQMQHDGESHHYRAGDEDAVQAMDQRIAYISEECLQQRQTAG